MVFTHPGTTMSPKMTFDLQKDKENDTERKKAFNKLKMSFVEHYTSNALPIVDIDWGGKGKGHNECTKDGEMAYISALMHWCTMDDKSAIISVNILKDWAKTNKIFKGNNAPLESAWCVCAFATSAELLKHSKSPNIRKAWTETEALFFHWIDNVIMPNLKRKDIWSWDPVNNWHFSIICARGQLAILRDNVVEWDWCVKTYKEILPKTIGFANCPCHISETKRDLTHAQFQIGGIIQFAEMAFHQGSHLYNPKIADVIEYHASIMLQEVPAGIAKEDIKTPYGFYYEPVWEIAFAHFHLREGKLMHKCDAWLQTFRPERVCFQWGAGTLTHYNRAAIMSLPPKL